MILSNDELDKKLEEFKKLRYSEYSVALFDLVRSDTISYSDFYYIMMEMKRFFS